MLQTTSMEHLAADRTRRLSIGFLNWAHALDHYVILIYPTVVIGLALVYGRTYADLIALGTGSFLAFGVFSLPAGWLADRWSRRSMMALFYIGGGLSLAAAAFAPNLTMLTIALCAVGMFAAIYHPVGTAMVIESAVRRGPTMAFNGVCGNLGAALAAGITAALIAGLGWRGAFLTPAVVMCSQAAPSIWRAGCPTTARMAGTSAALRPDVALRPAAAGGAVRPVRGGGAERGLGLQHDLGRAAEDRR